MHHYIRNATRKPAPNPYPADTRPSAQDALRAREQAARDRARAADMARNVVSPAPDVVAALRAGNAPNPVQRITYTVEVTRALDAPAAAPLREGHPPYTTAGFAALCVCGVTWGRHIGAMCPRRDGEWEPAAIARPRTWRDAETAEEALKLAGFVDAMEGWGSVCAARARHPLGTCVARFHDDTWGSNGRLFGPDFRAAIAHALGES